MLQKMCVFVAEGVSLVAIEELGVRLAQVANHTLTHFAVTLLTLSQAGSSFGTDRARTVAALWH